MERCSARCPAFARTSPRQESDEVKVVGDADLDQFIVAHAMNEMGCLEPAAGIVASTESADDCAIELQLVNLARQVTLRHIRSIPIRCAEEILVVTASDARASNRRSN